MKKDILLDEDGDLKIENGDFVVGVSIYQDVELLLKTALGTLRSDGLWGLNIVEELNNDGGSNFRRKLREQLQRDAKNLKYVNIDNTGKFTIDVEEL